jgi:hypothetical protein
MAHYWRLTIWYILSPRREREMMDDWSSLDRSKWVASFLPQKVVRLPKRFKKKQGKCSLIIPFDNVFRLLGLPFSSNLIRRRRLCSSSSSVDPISLKSPITFLFYFLTFPSCQFPFAISNDRNYWRSPKNLRIDTKTRSGSSILQ